MTLQGNYLVARFEIGLMGRAGLPQLHQVILVPTTAMSDRRSFALHKHLLWLSA
jgi:hypothetical protein